MIKLQENLKLDWQNGFLSIDTRKPDAGLIKDLLSYWTCHMKTRCWIDKKAFLAMIASQGTWRWNDKKGCLAIDIVTWTPGAGLTKAMFSYWYCHMDTLRPDWHMACLAVDCDTVKFIRNMYLDTMATAGQCFAQIFQILFWEVIFRRYNYRYPMLTLQMFYATSRYCVYIESLSRI